MTVATELALGAALAHLAEGALLAFPTETVWGLAADVRSGAAVGRLLALKGRRESKPLSVMVSGPAAVRGLGAELTEPGRRLAEAFWPGPLTLVVPAMRGLAGGVAGPGGEDRALPTTRGATTLGLRCPSHPDAARLVQEAERVGIGPLTATSLNRSDEPPIASRSAARRFVGGHPGLAMLAGAECGGTAPSTVVDCCCDPPRLLREGSLEGAYLVEVCGSLRPPLRETRRAAS